VLTKGAKKALAAASGWPDSQYLWVSALAALGAALLCALVAVPLLARKIERYFAT
jgi:hypothetical protein